MRKILWARQRQKQNHKEKDLLSLHQEIISMDRRHWIVIEPGKHSLSAYEISKKVIHLLRHSQQVHREEDGAVHFWSIKNF